VSGLKTKGACQQRVVLRAKMRPIHLFLLASLAGCAAESAGPPPVTNEQRQAIKQNLMQLQAKVTAEAPEGLFLSLRNTHVEIRELGGAIDGTLRTRRDVQDFGIVCEAVAKPFLDAAELEAFQQRLREALSPSSPTTVRAEYGRIALTLTRAPLHLVFSQKPSLETP
jgi:hypothetical protein